MENNVSLLFVLPRELTLELFPCSNRKTYKRSFRGNPISCYFVKFNSILHCNCDYTNFIYLLSPQKEKRVQLVEFVVKT
jgi:hypothetical protein